MVKRLERSVDRITEGEKVGRWSCLAQRGSSVI